MFLSGTLIAYEKGIMEQILWDRTTILWHIPDFIGEGITRCGEYITGKTSTRKRVYRHHKLK
jgi:hypothetical protein